MRNKKFNYIILGAGVLVIVLIVATHQQRMEWQATWHENDADPLGGKGLHAVAEQQFPGRNFRSVYEPLNMGLESDSSSVLILSKTLRMGPVEWRALTRHLENGNTALIAAHHFYGAVQDSLKHSVSYSSMQEENPTLEDVLSRESRLQWKIEGFPRKPVKVKGHLGKQRLLESSTLDESVPTLLETYPDYPLIKEFRMGKGSLYLSSAPLALTNFYLMDTATAEVGMGMLSLLPADRDVRHFEYYQMGRMESTTPLRYFLQEPGLRFATYVGLAGLLLYFGFSMKRRQRIIPEIKPPRNSSLDFVRTLGDLYLKNSTNHSQLMQKRRQYFYDFAYRRYGVRPSLEREEFIEALQAKTDFGKDRLKSLVYFVEQGAEKGAAETTLLKMEEYLYEFYNQS